jgi:hypothetical protein
MTSQIAIFNHSGVAIASDTVTTLGQSKTLGNSTKIFQLPEPHALVVLHNGAVYVNSVNGRLLLTEWARQLTKLYPTVEDYYKSFVEWFNSSRAIHSRDSEEKLLISAVEDYFRWLSERADAAVSEIEFDEDRTPEQYEEIRKKTCLDELESRIQSSSKWRNYEDLSDVTATEILTKAQGLNLTSLAKSYFDRFNLPKNAITKIQKAAVYGVSRVSPMSSDSEFVFAGFGSSESFAQEFQLKVRGAYGGRLRFIVETDGVEADHPRATLVPLAQKDAIDSFGRGWNPRVRDAVYEEIWDKAWNEIYSSQVNPNMQDEDFNKIGQSATNIRDAVMKAVDDYSLNNFVYPLMDTVDAMSLTSIAELAESLIGIQAASTYGKKGAATVGGFVEVITIDRQNGVRWRKRLPE